MKTTIKIVKLTTLKESVNKDTFRVVKFQIGIILIDAHCHIIPNVDDGSCSLEESVQMLQTAKDLGIDHIVATSHNRDRFASYQEQIEAFNQLKPVADKLGIQIIQGFENYWQTIYDMDPADYKTVTFGRSNLILIEFSHGKLPIYWQNVIYETTQQDLQVIIAHPERYTDIQDDVSFAMDMKNMGAYFMCSANFLDKEFLHHSGSLHRRTVKKMLKEGLVDMICSDAHCPEHYRWLLPAWDYAAKYGYDNDRSQAILSEAFVSS